MKQKTFVWLAFFMLTFIGVGLLFTFPHQSSSCLQKISEQFDAVMGCGYERQSMTEIEVMYTYENKALSSQIHYYILKTTYSKNASMEATVGLNTQSLHALFIPDLMENCQKTKVNGWDAALFKSGAKAFLCWSCSPEITFVLEYHPAILDDADIVRMAESIKPEA